MNYDKDTLRFDSASIGPEVPPNDAQGSSPTAILTLIILEVIIDETDRARHPT